MKFALLYYYNPKQTSPNEEEIADWMTLDQAVKDAGEFIYEAGFHSANKAQQLSIREGKPMSESGAMISEGNVLAGLYVVDVADKDAAVEWAKRIPTARYGVIEIRQIVEFAQ